jgi:hypothetical protein
MQRRLEVLKAMTMQRVNKPPRRIVIENSN